MLPALTTVTGLAAPSLVKPVGLGKGSARLKMKTVVRSLYFLIRGRFRLLPVIPLTGKTTRRPSFAPSVLHKCLFPEQTVAENKSRAELRCVLTERQLRGSGETHQRRVSGGKKRPLIKHKERGGGGGWRRV